VSFIGDIGSGLRNFFNSLLGATGRFFDSLFQSEIHIVDNLQHIVDKFNDTKLSIERETKLIADFKFDPKWKSRVINVPIAIKQIQMLVSHVAETFKGKLETLKAPIHDLALIFKAEAAPASDQEKPSAIARAGVKVDEIATMIDQLAKAMDVVADFAHFAEDITKELKTLDHLFLQQKNKQKKVTLTIRQRQGS
jgi:hypothetical protein